MLAHFWQQDLCWWQCVKHCQVFGVQMHLGCHQLLFATNGKRSIRVSFLTHVLASVRAPSLVYKPYGHTRCTVAFPIPSGIHEQNTSFRQAIFLLTYQVIFSWLSYGLFHFSRWPCFWSSLFQTEQLFQTSHGNLHKSSALTPVLRRSKQFSHADVCNVLHIVSEYCFRSSAYSFARNYTKERTYCYLIWPDHMSQKSHFTIVDVIQQSSAWSSFL